MKEAPQAIIIGGGLAGLSCAVNLMANNITFLLLEGQKTIGGRVQTDRFEDFCLDRGFQVLLTAYPEAQRILNYDELKLHPFQAASLIRFSGHFHKVSDPFRHPLDIFTMAISPVGTWHDKILLARLRQRLCNASPSDITSRPDSGTLKYLQRAGFSTAIIDRFFRPLIGGATLDKNLNTSSRMFETLFRTFATGDAALPEGGIGAITQQLFRRLPKQSVRTNSKVLSIQDGIVNLPHGETLGAHAIVVATDAPEAQRLLGNLPTPAFRAVTCLYYAAQRPPFEEPLIVLNGENQGPINNLSVLTNICPAYAPQQQALISVTVLGTSEEDEMDFEATVRKQLVEWFPDDAAKWRYLRTYKIKQAQPEQTPTALSVLEKPVKVRQGVFVCGDHRDTASIHGALLSGKRAAEAVINDLAN
jgi:phytoene dehydrogenase-like protein